MNYNKMTKAELIEALKAIGRSRKVTERKQAEKRFQRLLESAPDAMVLVDKQGKIVLVNSQTETLFGYQREELLGQTVEILMPERFRRQHMQHRADYVIEPRVRPMGAGLELYGQRKDGSTFNRSQAPIHMTSDLTADRHDPLLPRIANAEEHDPRVAAV